MAKVKHINFLHTVDDVLNDAKKQGILNLYLGGEVFIGRQISVKGTQLFQFGTTGYLAFEQDERLKKAVAEAIFRNGTPFPLSKTYIFHPLYSGVEDKRTQMFGDLIVITKNSSLRHMGVMPSSVSESAPIILDHPLKAMVMEFVGIMDREG